MKNFFKKIFSFIKMLFGNIDEWVTNHIQPSIEFVQKIKDLLDNPVADVITALIPGSIDDEIRSKILLNCQRALKVLSITAEIANESDPVTQINMLLQYLKTVTPAMKSAIYKQLASEMAKISAGKTSVRGHSVDLLTQVKYSQMVENLQPHEIPDVEDENDSNESEENVTTTASTEDLTPEQLDKAIAAKNLQFHQ